ncbi:MAG: 30S ribosomal protein S8 [bacterium]
MATIDPIADLLTRIRNAIMAKHSEVEVGVSRIKIAIINILKDGGYIRGYKITGEDQKKAVKIFLKYDKKNVNVISGLKRISKSSRRVYVNKSSIPYVLGGLGIAIISTSRGILTDRACRKANIGGEVMCYVW